MDQDPGLTGNLLVERLVGAHIELISREEYGKIGSVVCLLLFLQLSAFLFMSHHLLLFLLSSRGLLMYYVICMRKMLIY